MKRLRKCLHVKNVRIILAILLVTSSISLVGCKQNVVEVEPDTTETVSETSAETSTTDVQKENPIVIDESVPETENTETSSESEADAPITEAETTSDSSSAADPSATSKATGNLANSAAALIGSTYKADSASPNSGFDNSGLIWYVLTESGYNEPPRALKAQSEIGSEVAWGDIQAGDLLFFGEDGKIQFGGIATENGHMVYAANPKDNVIEADISTPYWEKAFVTARRAG